MIRPGMYVAAYDTHVPNYGAVGALGFPFVTEIADVLTFGSVWVRTPHSVRVHLTGRLPPWVSIRDLAQRIIADLDPDIVDYSVVEFAGPGLQDVPIDGRLTLCNTPLEIGAKSAIVTPDEVTASYLKERCDGTVELVASDPGARFAHETSYDLGEITPQIAVPPTPDNVRPISRRCGNRIDHAFIGSCASGMLSDLRDAAAVLRGRKVHPDVRLFVTPASYGILAAAAREKSSRCSRRPGPCSPRLDAGLARRAGSRSLFGRRLHQHRHPKRFRPLGSDRRNHLPRFARDRRLLGDRGSNR